MEAGSRSTWAGYWYGGGDGGGDGGRSDRNKDRVAVESVTVCEEKGVVRELSSSKVCRYGRYKYAVRDSK